MWPNHLICGSLDSFPFCVSVYSVVPCPWNLISLESCTKFMGQPKAKWEVYTMGHCLGKSPVRHSIILPGHLVHAFLCGTVGKGCFCPTEESRGAEQSGDRNAEHSTVSSKALFPMEEETQREHPKVAANKITINKILPRQCWYKKYRILIWNHSPSMIN